MTFALTPNGVVRRAVQGQAPFAIGSALLHTGHQVGETLVPVVIGLVIDQAVETGNESSLLIWIAALAATFVCLSYSYRYGARVGQRAVLGAGHDLRVALTRRVLDPAGGAGRGRLAGDLMNVATQDALRIGGFNNALAGVISAIASLLVAAVVLLQISIPLGMLVLLGTPVLLGMTYVIGKPLERRLSAEQAAAAQAAGIAADLIRGLRVLKGVGAEATAAQRYRSASQAFLASTLRAARVQAVYQSATLVLSAGFVTLVAFVGGRLATEGLISVGELIAAVGVTQFLQGPFARLMVFGAAVARARASAARVANVLSAPPAVTTNEPAALPSPIEGRLQLRDLSLGSLRGVTLEVAPGELLGIATTDPADAAALADGLSRTADPASGSIELDGVPLHRLAPADVHAAILVASHDSDLFRGSLRQNIGAAAGSGDHLTAAMAASAADEVAANMPAGLDTVITEQGRSLSGGQRQRIALARALAAEPPVLALFEPTTAVDSVTESRIAGGLRDYRSGRTTLIVTSSPTLLAVCDRVVFVENGKLTAMGSHAELLLAQTSYRATVLS